MSDKKKSTLTLAEKPFMYAKVKRVTVTEEAVLVPLIPITLEVNDVQLNAANDLIQLVKQGYPWEKVDDWLECMLTPKSYAQTKKHFTKGKKN